MPYKLDPVNDPNEIYAVIPRPAELGGPTDWWAVTAHGVPVWHFPLNALDLSTARTRRPMTDAHAAPRSKNEDWE